MNHTGARGVPSWAAAANGRVPPSAVTKADDDALESGAGVGVWGMMAIVPNSAAPDSIGLLVVLTHLTAGHRDLDLDVLEQLSVGAHSVAARVLEAGPGVHGAVVLATCNRFEVYLDVPTPQDGGDGRGAKGGPALSAAAATERAVAAAHTRVVDVVTATSGLPPVQVAAALGLDPLVGEDTVRHLFTVAAGLDSMVVGEREVSGQVRRALATARADGTTSAGLEALFQTAARVARTVGRRTGLGGAGRSVVSVALDLAAAQLAAAGRDLAEARVLLVGTGSYAGASLSALHARGVRDVAVHSPSGRARQFAAHRAVTAVEPADLADRLTSTDVVVSCSGTLGPVIDRDVVLAARAGGAGPSVVVDLALRHDVDPAVADLPGVRLIDLAAVAAHAPAVVTPAVRDGVAVVEAETAQFLAAAAEREAAPAVRALREYVWRLVEAEVARAGGDERAERAVRRLAAAVLHGPMSRARELAREGRADELAHALEVLGLAPTDVGR
jgi:glutamyl-tRNA reductase